MQDWDIEEWTWAEHMRRARAEFGAHWPQADNDITAELGEDEQGSVNREYYIADACAAS